MNFLEIAFLVMLFAYVLYAVRRMMSVPPFSLLETVADVPNKQSLSDTLENHGKLIDRYGHFYLKFNNETYGASRWRYLLLKDALFLVPTFPFKWLFKPLRIPLGRLSYGGRSRAFRFLPTRDFHISGEDRLVLMIPRSIAERLRPFITEQP